MLEITQPISYVMQHIFILSVLIPILTLILSYLLLSETGTNRVTMCVTLHSKTALKHHLNINVNNTPKFFFAGKHLGQIDHARLRM